MQSTSLAASPCSHRLNPAIRRAGSRPNCRHPRTRTTINAVSREVLSQPERTKIDDGDDRTFYGLPRLVKHVDDTFLAQVTELYRQLIPPGGEVLDLCSSWVSHLPPEVSYSRVVGHGMNAAELARNPRLDTFFVRDLNSDPDGWALKDRSFDAVVICVSVQYLQKPERVFAEIYRVLKPGGVCIVTFSNRMFYTKAIQAWRETTMFGRVQLVKQYFSCIPGFTPPLALKEVPLPGRDGTSRGSGGGGDPVEKLLAQLQKFMAPAASDPFVAVIAHRDFKPESIV